MWVQYLHVTHMTIQMYFFSYVCCNFLHQSVHPIKVQKTQAKDPNPGLRDFEASVIRLLDKTIIGFPMEVNQISAPFYYQLGLFMVS